MQAIEKNVKDKSPRGEELSLKPRLLSHLFRDEGLLEASGVRCAADWGRQHQAEHQAKIKRNKERKERTTAEREREGSAGGVRVTRTRLYREARDRARPSSLWGLTGTDSATVIMPEIILRT